MTSVAGSTGGVEPLDELATLTAPLKSARKLSRSSSIKHLISFYETAYTKKSGSHLSDESVNAAPVSAGNPKFQRQTSNPVIRYSESLHFKSKLHRDATLLLSQKRQNYVNTPLSSYSVSLSSSSSSSSAEKLSFSSSFKEESIKNIDAAGSQSTLSSPSSNLLCSVSSTSASSSTSAYSSGYSSPSLSELLTSEHALPPAVESNELPDKPTSDNSNNNCSKPSKTSSFTDLQAGFVSAKQRFTKYKFNNASLTKLFDNKGKQAAHPKEKDKEKEPPLNDLMNYFIQFKSIKKVLNTVKLCNSDNKSAAFDDATARIPEEEPEHECVDVKLLPVDSNESAAAQHDSPARNNVNSACVNEENSIKTSSQPARPSTRATHLEARKKTNLVKLASAPNGNFTTFFKYYHI